MDTVPAIVGIGRVNSAFSKICFFLKKKINNKIRSDSEQGLRSFPSVRLILQEPERAACMHVLKRGVAQEWGAGPREPQASQVSYVGCPDPGSSSSHVRSPRKLSFLLEKKK